MELGSHELRKKTSPPDQILKKNKSNQIQLDHKQRPKHEHKEVNFNPNNILETQNSCKSNIKLTKGRHIKRPTSQSLSKHSKNLREIDDGWRFMSERKTNPTE